MNDNQENNSLQRKFWEGEFGDSYVERNNSIEEANTIYKEMAGVTIEEIYANFFAGINKENKILELGCNILQNLGFKDLYGLEINKKAYEIARRNNPKITFINSTIEDFNSKDTKYDLVFTSGVLIHIHPSVIKTIINKIIDLTKEYIFGFEYYADALTEVNYRGHANVLWKQNFPKLFLESTTSIKSIKEQKIPYKNSNLCDIAYLLKKLN